jgi:O-antigen/teichoic acid export membrane protein
VSNYSPSWARMAAATIIDALTAGRGRTLTVDIVTSVTAKGAGLAAPLLITPACFRYLGDQRYGLWMAITALTSMAWFADLGLGNGLLTRLSRSDDDAPSRAREVSSAYATLGIVTMAMLPGLVLVVSVVPWAGLFGVTDPAIAGEAPLVVVLCFGAFMINVPLSLIQRIQYARGQVTQSNLWQAAGSALSVAAVLGAIAANASPIVVIACTVLAFPVGNLLNTVVYFGVQDRLARPRIKRVHRKTAAGLLRLGVQFAALTALSSIALYLDNPLVAHVLGVAAAAHYAVVGKLFGALAMFIWLVGMAVWPANSAALASGDVAWVRRTTRTMLVLHGVMVGAAGLGLVVFGHQLLALWIDGVDVSMVPSAVLGGLALWSLLVAVTSPLMMVQNSVGLLRPQLVGWSAFLLLAAPLKLWALREFGLVGLPAAACVAYLLTMGPAAVVGYRRALAASQRRPVPPDTGDPE